MINKKAVLVATISLVVFLCSLIIVMSSSSSSKKEDELDNSIFQFDVPKEEQSEDSYKPDNSLALNEIDLSQLELMGDFDMSELSTKIAKVDNMYVVTIINNSKAYLMGQLDIIDSNDNILQTNNFNGWAVNESLTYQVEEEPSTVKFNDIKAYKLKVATEMDVTNFNLESNEYRWLEWENKDITDKNIESAMTFLYYQSLYSSNLINTVYIFDKNNLPIEKDVFTNTSFLDESKANVKISFNYNNFTLIVSKLENEVYTETKVINLK